MTKKRKTVDWRFCVVEKLQSNGSVTEMLKTTLRKSGHGILKKKADTFSLRPENQSPSEYNLQLFCRTFRVISQRHEFSHERLTKHET